MGDAVVAGAPQVDFKKPLYKLSNVPSWRKKEQRQILYMQKGHKFDPSKAGSGLAPFPAWPGLGGSVARSGWVFVLFVLALVAPCHSL